MELDQELTEIYQEHADALFRYGAGLARDAEDAHDGVQEVFLHYFMERSCGRVIHSPRAWLYQSLRNHLLNRLRAASNREVSIEDLEGMPGDEQTPETIMAKKQLMNGMCAGLTERERECLQCRTDGLSYAEIGAALTICSGTVGALLARAYKKIRQPAELAIVSG